MVVKLPSLGKKNKEGHRAHTLQQRAAVTRQSIPLTRSRGHRTHTPSATCDTWPCGKNESHLNPIAPFKEKYAEGG